MRSLPFASARVGGIVAFYSLFHLRRAELGAVLREFRRVLRPGGRVLFSTHEGEGDAVIDRFLDEPVLIEVPIEKGSEASPWPFIHPAPHTE